MPIDAVRFSVRERRGRLRQVVLDAPTRNGEESRRHQGIERRDLRSRMTPSEEGDLAREVVDVAVETGDLQGLARGVREPVRRL